jgi:hypothetical protein
MCGKANAINLPFGMVRPLAILSGESGDCLLLGLPHHNTHVYIYIYMYIPSGYDSSPWEDPPMLLIGKPSISMGHLYHGYVK